jgi:hypothetical protein
MTKMQNQTVERHGLLPLINNLLARLRPHTNRSKSNDDASLLPFEGTDAHTEQDIGFHHDGRPHERDEWRF